MPILKELPVIVCVCHVPDIDEINIHEHTNKNKRVFIIITVKVMHSTALNKSA